MLINKKITAIILSLMILVVAALSGVSVKDSSIKKIKPTVQTTVTLVLPKGTVATETPSATSTSTPTETETMMPMDTDTPEATFTEVFETATASITPSITSTVTVSPTPESTTFPHLGAALCPDSGEDHDTSVFHTLWDSTRDCHYDHEHGQNPFTTQVEEEFPGFDLFMLLGGVHLGHTNPSSPAENTIKHGGMKFNVQLQSPQECLGFESAVTGVNGSVVQFHGFGNYEIEGEARLHSSVALLRQCRTDNPTDYGYVFINQLQDYGNRISPYQGTILPYPNQPVPSFPSPDGPYFSMPCVDIESPFDIHCRAGLPQAQANAASTVWTAKVTGRGHSDVPALFRPLWRAEDVYKVVIINDWPNATYPLGFLWLCSSDGGHTYNPVGCKYNNTTTQIQEIQGFIPYSWDGMLDWDTDPRAGRVTAQGFVDGAGNVNPACTEAGSECYPVKLVNAFTGSYGTVLVFTSGKGTNIVPINPERDIYFCNGTLCNYTVPGAIPSGWLGENN